MVGKYFVILGESNIDALKRISDYPCACNKYTSEVCRSCIAAKALNDMQEVAAKAIDDILIFEP